jgi:hypothetical protein
VTSAGALLAQVEQLLFVNGTAAAGGPLAGIKATALV